jgi:ribulose kinase
MDDSPTQLSLPEARHERGGDVVPEMKAKKLFDLSRRFPMFLEEALPAMELTDVWDFVG